MIRSLIGLTSAFSMLLTIAGIPAVAGSKLPKFRDGLPLLLRQRIEGLRSSFLSLDDSEAARGFYSTAEQWPPDVTKLRVCFMEGSKEIRAKIAEIATAWEDNELGIKLDFGKMTDPRKCDPNSSRTNHIRIGFRQPGFWSLVGQGSLIYAKQDEQSMNFEDFDKSTPDQLETAEGGYLKGTIIHEFGHAIGFRHEHQSPIGNCDAEYDWPHVYKYMEGPPNNWPKDQVDFNMRTATESTLMASDFDPDSIMLYVFPAEFYLQRERSPCFHSTNNVKISATDRETVDYMYPADQSERQKRFAENRAAFEGILAKASEASKAALPDYAQIFFSAKQ